MSEFSHVEAIAVLDQLRDDLVEARRYVLRSPEAARQAIGRFLARLDALRRIRFAASTLPLLLLENQIDANLEWGLKAIASCPTALIGAIDLTSMQLAWVRGWIERAPGGGTNDA